MLKFRKILLYGHKPCAHFFKSRFLSVSFFKHALTGRERVKIFQYRGLGFKPGFKKVEFQPEIAVNLWVVFLQLQDSELEQSRKPETCFIAYHLEEVSSFFPSQVYKKSLLLAQVTVLLGLFAL